MLSAAKHLQGVGVRSFTPWRCFAALSMTILRLILGAGVAFSGAVLRAQPVASGPVIDSRSAPALVHDGNKLLLSDKPADALQLYELAEERQPDAAEIAFVQGLGHYKLGEYDKAKAAFQEAAAAQDQALADDALYSAGTCDHAAALADTADPKKSLSRLESAMQSYQEVLARNSKHEAARESNLKAATKWRQIKQQLEQQQQQQDQQNQDQDSQDDQQDQEQQQQQQDPESKNQEEKDQQQQNQEQQDQQEQEQQSSSQKEGDEKEQQQQANNEKQDQQEQEASAEQKQQAQEEQVSREQAERQLREMMQALKDRAKLRREQQGPVQVRRAEKDW